MAEIVGSAVVSEVVSRLSSFLSGKHEERTTTDEKVERLEMAVLKIHTAVIVSEGWEITHRPLIHWKDKLKHVAEEGDEILHSCKRRILEDKAEGDNTACRSSFPECIIGAAKRFLSFGRRAEELSSGTVRRFERLADGADSFFKFVESGGRPKRFMFFQPFDGYLLAGKSVQCSFRIGSGVALILFLPWLEDPERGPEGCLFIAYEDDRTWEKNLKLVVGFHLSEIIDVAVVVMKCLELMPPQFGTARATIRECFHRMGLQRIDYVNPSAMSLPAWYSRHLRRDHCKISYDRLYGCQTCPGGGILPEPVLRIVVVCYISPPNNNSSGNTKPPLELQCYIWPHFIEEQKNCSKYGDVGPHVLGELLPKADGGVYKDTEVFENRKFFGSSSHGTIYLSSEPAVHQPATLWQYWMKNAGAYRSAGRPRARRNSNHMTASKRRRHNLRSGS